MFSTPLFLFFAITRFATSTSSAVGRRDKLARKSSSTISSSDLPAFNKSATRVFPSPATRLVTTDDVHRFRARQNSSKTPRVIWNVGILPFTGEARRELISIGLHDVLDHPMNAEVVRAEIFGERLEQFGIRRLNGPRLGRWILGIQ